MNDAIEFHEQWATRWENKYRRFSFVAREKILRSCLKGVELNSKRWLDAGCGTGTLSRLLAHRGCIVHCVDAAPTMIKIAAKEATKDPHGKNMSFQCVKTIEHLSYDNESFDGILCSSVLEYLDNPDLCLAEFARILKPSGILLVSVPNRYSIVRRGLCGILRLTGVLGKPWPGYLQYSRNEYTPAEFKSKLEANGFIIIKSIHFGYPSPMWLHRIKWIGSLIMFVAFKKG